MALPLLVVMCFFAACGGRQAKHSMAPVERNDAEQKAMAIYINNPDSALAILDEGVSSGKLPRERYDYLRACIYSVNPQFADSARRICRRLLNTPAVFEDKCRRSDLLRLLVSISQTYYNDADVVRWAHELESVDQELGYRIEALLARAEVGSAMTRIGREQEGIKFIDEAISSLSAPGERYSWQALDAFILASKRKIRYLDEHKQFKGVEECAQAILRRLDHYEKHPDKYPSAYSDWEIPTDTASRAEYIDFYRTQAYAFMAQAFAGQGDMTQARRYAAMFDATRSSSTLQQQSLMLPAWLAIGDFGRINAVIDRCTDAWGADTVTHNYAMMLYYKSQMAQRQGNHREAAAMLSRYVALDDSLTLMTHRSLVRDYAERYHEQHLKRMDEITAHREARRNIISVATFILFLITLGFAVYYYRQRRLLDTKNRILTKQIAEALGYAEHDETPLAAAQNQSDTQQQAKPLEEMNDKELFTYLSSAIVNKQMYLDPEFSRKQLITQFGVTKERIGQAFSRGSDYTSLPDFINDCRLEAACRMLIENPEKSISEVAVQCGFAQPATFSRNFRTKYSLSPSEFRKSRR